MTGNAGSGKTTLAAEIGALLGLPVHGLDSIVWQPGWRKTPQAEKEAAIRVLTARPAWVIDGVSTIVEEAADLIVFLDVPPHVCLRRCLWRSLRHLFRSRPGLPPDCPEWRILHRMPGIIFRFERWVKPGILARLAGRPTPKRVVIRNRKDRTALLEGFGAGP